MPKEVIESIFFLQIEDTYAAPPGAVKAYIEAKKWSLGIPTTDRVYAGASLHPGEKKGFRGFYVEKYLEEFSRSVG